MSDLVEIGTVKLTGILVFIGLLGVGFGLGFVSARIFPAQPETQLPETQLIEVGPASQGPICVVREGEGREYDMTVDLSPGKPHTGAVDRTILPCLKP